MASDTTVGKVYAALHAVIAEIGAIGKNNTNSFQKYQFRSVGQAMAALQPLLVKHKLILQPNVTGYQMMDQEKGAGCVLMLQLNFIHIEDGSSLVVSSVGQGSDSGDKAVDKALAGAFKYAVFQTFCVPEDGMDAENFEPEVKMKPKATGPTKRNILD
jgi:hypothetical protein